MGAKPTHTHMHVHPHMNEEDSCDPFAALWSKNVDKELRLNLHATKVKFDCDPGETRRRLGIITIDRRCLWSHVPVGGSC